MAQTGTAMLRAKGLAALKGLGYRQTFATLKGSRSRSVYRFAKDESESWFLVQCRHHQAESNRYLIGILVEPLNRVDKVALYFEDESKILILPAAVLREIHQDRIDAGDASYTGQHNEQWRVDFYLSEEKLSPQGSNGYRYDVSRYFVKVPT